jgi:hypothetical protein
MHAERDRRGELTPDAVLRRGGLARATAMALMIIRPTLQQHEAGGHPDPALQTCAQSPCQSVLAQSQALASAGRGT